MRVGVHRMHLLSREMNRELALLSIPQEIGRHGFKSAKGTGHAVLSRTPQLLISLMAL